MRIPRQAFAFVCLPVHSPAFAFPDPLHSRRSYTNYARLVMFSFGFQKAFQRGFQADDEVFFTRVRIFFARGVLSGGVNTSPKSLESAKAVVNVLVESLVPTGYIRFAPDSA
jgi:hypothetical protein